MRILPFVLGISVWAAPALANPCDKELAAWIADPFSGSKEKAFEDCKSLTNSKQLSLITKQSSKCHCPGPVFPVIGPPKPGSPAASEIFQALLDIQEKYSLKDSDVSELLGGSVSFQSSINDLKEKKFEKPIILDLGVYSSDKYISFSQSLGADLVIKNFSDLAGEEFKLETFVPPPESMLNWE